MAKKSLCSKCTGLCCRYYALEIDKPKTRGDYDDIRWFLCHRGTEIFVEDGGWYVKVNNRCKYLSVKDHKCKIYEKRPRICRQYRHKGCDFSDGNYELHFTSDNQIEEYAKEKLAKKRKKKKGSRKK
ncbi:MAG: YkgJ family cysteine cluster protein [Phycisphaerae bacterium]|nr:YkgJ family cysteine cluster protein [Phycisphaerae bacterium]